MNEHNADQTDHSSMTGQRIAKALGAILKSLTTVTIFALLILQVVELGLLLEKVSALEARQQTPAREESPRIPAPAASPTPLAEDESEIADLKVELLAAEADGDGLTLTLEAHQSGPATLLFERPALEGKRGKTYELAPDWLEEARFALLDTITHGRAEFELRFTPAPGEGEDLTLVFNSDHPRDDPLAPRVEISIAR